MKHLSFFFLIGLLGCQTTTDSEKDALLLNPTAEVQLELSSVISKILGGPKVLLNAEDLTKNSILPVERVRLNDSNGVRMQGLETEEPSYFKLIKKGEDCFLILLKSDKREQIKSAKCQ